MGILDEAIREHLELKRSHGAAAEELERLEKEAFGPPTRPGEPDFPEAEAAAGEAFAVEAPEADLEAVGQVPTEAPTTVAEDLTEAVPAGEDPQPAAEADVPIAEDAEQLEADDLGAAPVTEFYDRADEDLDLDELDLDLDAEQEPGRELEAGLDEPDATALEEPIQEAAPALADAEEPFAEDSGVAPQADEEGEDDDVLADTPEFLRDAPEDDELWFEQGEPKDFDFD